MRMPAFPQGGKGLWCCGFYGVCDGEGCGGLAIDGEEDDGGTAAAQGFALFCKVSDGDVEFGEEFGVAKRDALALHHANRSFACR